MRDSGASITEITAHILEGKISTCHDNEFMIKSGGLSGSFVVGKFKG